MGKVKWIVLFGVLLMVVSAPALAGARTDSRVVLQEDGTTEASATVAGYIASLAVDGTRTAISISNTLWTPSVEGATISGFPEGGDTAGPVWAFCYDTLAEDGPAEWVFNSADHPEVGTGLDANGNLVPGATWLVYNDEMLSALGFDPEVDSFAGYCYFVGEFDAMVGTYINLFELAFGQQAFPLQSDFTGVAIDID